MPFTPDQPYPKKQSDNIRSKDWNDAVEEIRRLDTAKLNLAGGGNIKGPLTVSGNVGIGTDALFEKLQIDGTVLIVRPGQNGPAELRLYNGGSVAEWALRQLRADAGNPKSHNLNISKVVSGTYSDFLTVDPSGNVGIGTGDPRCRLDVSGAANVWADNRYAVPNNFMAPGSLTIGSTTRNYGGGSLWNTNTAGLLFEAQDNTEMAVHDSGARITSLMYYEGGPNRVTIGRDMGWGPLNILHLSARVGVGANEPVTRLAVGGNGVNIYETDIWVERNMHVQGNETLAQGGRGRLRVGTAWSYVGIYADVTSTGAANDLVLGGSSGNVRIGPPGGGQGLVIKDWTIFVDGNNLFFRRGTQIVAKLSTDWDRFMVFRNLNGRAPYFYFNQDGTFGVHNG